MVKKVINFYLKILNSGDFIIESFDDELLEEKNSD